MNLRRSKQKQDLPNLLERLGLSGEAKRAALDAINAHGVSANQLATSITDEVFPARDGESGGKGDRSRPRHVVARASCLQLLQELVRGTESAHRRVHPHLDCALWILSSALPQDFNFWRERRAGGIKVSNFCRRLLASVKLPLALQSGRVWGPKATRWRRRLPASHSWEEGGFSSPRV